MNEKLLDKPNQSLVCVDENGNDTGSNVLRKNAHSTPGKKHLAIQVVVFTPDKKIIMHWRPAKKVGGEVLDVPTTHVLSGESKEQAAVRCLKDEYGIHVGEEDVKILNGFSYEKDYGDGTCENEFCIASYLVFSGDINENPEHVDKIEYVNAKELLQRFRNDKGKFPVWLLETVRIIKDNAEAKKFFE